MLWYLHCFIANVLKITQSCTKPLILYFIQPCSHYIVLFLSLQRLQSTVLQRAGSKSQMGQVDEEAEARLAQEMREIREKEEDDVVVIGDEEPMSVNPTKELVIDVGGPGDQEVYPHPHQLHHPPMRELVRQHAICSSSPPAALLERPPLERAQSSPAVGVPISPKQTPEPVQKLRYTTGMNSRKC